MSGILVSNPFQMKSVSHEEWVKKAEGLAEWRKNRTAPPNLDIYRKIVSMVHVGTYVFDCGAGQCHLNKCLPDNRIYTASDPFPLNDGIMRGSAEYLIYGLANCYDTVFMLAALDNVQDVELSLKGLKHVAKENIVILTGIGIPPDKNHTVQIDRVDLISVLGEPFQEVEMLKNVFLFEWRL